MQQLLLLSLPPPPHYFFSIFLGEATIQMIQSFWYQSFTQKRGLATAISKQNQMAQKQTKWIFVFFWMRTPKAIHVQMCRRWRHPGLRGISHRVWIPPQMSHFAEIHCIIFGASVKPCSATHTSPRRVKGGWICEASEAQPSVALMPPLFRLVLCVCVPGTIPGPIGSWRPVALYCSPTPIPPSPVWMCCLAVNVKPCHAFLPSTMCTAYGMFSLWSVCWCWVNKNVDEDSCSLKIMVIFCSIS